MSLREILEAAAGEGHSLADLTVLARKNDPFRFDIETGHRDGRWFAEQLEALGLGEGTIHLRGIHYRLLDRKVRKPNGEVYSNTHGDWKWLGDRAADCARWLGYVPFERIVDQRNAEPVVHLADWHPEPQPYINVDVNVEVPDVDDLEPTVGLFGFHGMQPYRIVLFGEKSSLAEVLEPVAERYKADLYLMTGEISDTRMHRMAASHDGCPLVVLTFSDCDPASWQMPVSIARKLQAFKALEFPDLEFRVYKVALTVEQVQAYALASSPLKDTEKRKDSWLEAMGVEQTEIDALAANRPEILREIAEEAIAPFYDSGLELRVGRAYSAWRAEAQEALEEHLRGDEARQSVFLQAEEKLDELRVQIEAINRAMRLDPGDVELPPIPEIPEAEVSGENGGPLVDSSWSFAEQCRMLKRSKAYEVEP